MGVFPRPVTRKHSSSGGRSLSRLFRYQRGFGRTFRLPVARSVLLSLTSPRRRRVRRGVCQNPKEGKEVGILATRNKRGRSKTNSWAESPSDRGLLSGRAGLRPLAVGGRSGDGLAMSTDKGTERDHGWVECSADRDLVSGRSAAPAPRFQKPVSGVRNGPDLSIRMRSLVLIVTR